MVAPVGTNFKNLSVILKCEKLPGSVKWDGGDGYKKGIPLIMFPEIAMESPVQPYNTASYGVASVSKAPIVVYIGLDKTIVNAFPLVVKGTNIGQVDIELLGYTGSGPDMVSLRKFSLIDTIIVGYYPVFDTRLHRIAQMEGHVTPFILQLTLECAGTTNTLTAFGPDMSQTGQTTNGFSMINMAST